MFVIEEQIRIEAPAEDVFSRLARVAGYREWLDGSVVHRACRVTSDGPEKCGTKYRDDTWFGTFRGEIVDLDEPHRVVFQQALTWAGLRVMEARQANVLSSEGAGTILTHRFEGRLAPWLRFAEPVVKLLVRGERRRVLSALGESLGSQSATV